MSGSSSIPSWIDVSADLGEGCGWDEALLAFVTSASICCGAHAGTVEGIRATIERAVERGATIGAHPGYADRANFGRRDHVMSASRVEMLIREQVSFLAELAGQVGGRIQFLKPHGALYNQAQRDKGIAAGVVAAADLLGLPVLGLPGGTLAQIIAQEYPRVRLVGEGFADRGYAADGTLIPRGRSGALLHERPAVEAQARNLIGSARVETLCIHGDDPHCVAAAAELREILEAMGVGVRSFVESGR